MEKSETLRLGHFFLKRKQKLPVMFLCYIFPLKKTINILTASNHILKRISIEILILQRIHLCSYSSLPLAAFYAFTI